MAVASLVAEGLARRTSAEAVLFLFHGHTACLLVPRAEACDLVSSRAKGLHAAEDVLQDILAMVGCHEAVACLVSVACNLCNDWQSEGADTKSLRKGATAKARQLHRASNASNGPLIHQVLQGIAQRIRPPLQAPICAWNQATWNKLSDMWRAKMKRILFGTGQSSPTDVADVSSPDSPSMVLNPVPPGGWTSTSSSKLSWSRPMPGLHAPGEANTTIDSEVCRQLNN